MTPITRRSSFNFNVRCVLYVPFHIWIFQNIQSMVRATMCGTRMVVNCILLLRLGKILGSRTKRCIFLALICRIRGAEEELIESPQRKKLKSHGSTAATTVPKVAKVYSRNRLYRTTAMKTRRSTLPILKKRFSTVKL